MTTDDAQLRVLLRAWTARRAKRAGVEGFVDVNLELATLLAEMEAAGLVSVDWRTRRPTSPRWVRRSCSQMAMSDPDAAAAVLDAFIETNAASDSPRRREH